MPGDPDDYANLLAASEWHHHACTDLVAPNVLGGVVEEGVERNVQCDFGDGHELSGEIINW